MQLGELGIGRKVYEPKSGMIFLVAAQNHYGPGITTLLSEHVVAVRALDAAEGGAAADSFEQSGKYGDNNYLLSNLHQWLNSSQEAWYHPTHEGDAPPQAQRLRWGEHPYDQEPGFLTRFSQAFREGLVETDIPVLVRTGRGTAALTQVRASVFLPSRTEMNKGDELGIPEGRTLDIFYDHYIFKAKPSPDQLERYGRSWNPEEPEKGRFFDAPHIYDPKFGWWYYMRTPSTMYRFMQRIMTPYGSVSYTYANNDVAGIRPLFNLSAEMSVTDVGEMEAFYRLD